MRIFMLADFRREYPNFMMRNSRIFSKSFNRLGHDVFDCSYRNLLLQLSPIPGKKWALRWSKKKTDQKVALLAGHFQPDLIFITTFKLLDEITVELLKSVCPGARLACWYSDPPEGVPSSVLKIASLCDWCLATSGGPLLKQFRQVGVSHCAFIPNPADADIEFPGEVPASCRSHICFTGKLFHSLPGQDFMREQLVRDLVEKRNMTVWGCLGRRAVSGRDYFQVLRGAKISLSINTCNHIRFYHSDRIVHSLGCGTFVLAKYVPDSELLFEDKKHVCYFRTAEECFALADYYLDNETERQKIARQGYEHIHTHFSGQKLAGHIIELLEKGSYSSPWSEVV